MANSNRRLPDKDTKMFIPRNVDGGISDDHFLTGPKLFVLGISTVVVGYFIVVFYTTWNLIMGTLYSAIALYLYSLIIRYLVLNEKYYFSMYQRMKEIDVTTPAIFWGIINKHETDDGCVVTFNDLKMGIYIKLDRDSIVGREDSFKELHYDAISDFYSELNRNGLRFVKADIMEPAGKDERIQELDDLVIKSSYNANLHKLMNLQVAHIKNSTRATLYESEYMLIYTEKLERPDYVMDIVVEATHTLLVGGYSGFTILNGPEIDELVKHVYGVRIFDSNDATIQVFKGNANAVNAFKIKKVSYKDGTEKDIAEKVVVPMPTKNTKTNKRSLIKNQSPAAPEIDPIVAQVQAENALAGDQQGAGDDTDWSSFNAMLSPTDTSNQYVDFTRQNDQQVTNEKEFEIYTEGQDADELIDL